MKNVQSVKSGPDRYLCIMIRRAANIRLWHFSVWFKYEMLIDINRFTIIYFLCGMHSNLIKHNFRFFFDLFWIEIKMFSLKIFRKKMNFSIYRRKGVGLVDRTIKSKLIIICAMHLTLINLTAIIYFNKRCARGILYRCAISTVCVDGSCESLIFHSIICVNLNSSTKRWSFKIVLCTDPQRFEDKRKRKL